MKATIVMALAGSLTLAGIAAAQSPAARRLRHDPFDWTTLTQAVEKKGPEATALTATPAQPPRAPRLRAVMRGPSGARVNLEGVILAVGEAAEGYRLVEVRDHSAVFSRNGATVEIGLSAELGQ